MTFSLFDIDKDDEEEEEEEDWIEGYEPPPPDGVIAADITSEEEQLQMPAEEQLQIPKRRVKRQQAEPYSFDHEKTRCPLLLVADYRFFREMGGSNYKTTVNYLVSFWDENNCVIGGRCIYTLH